MILSSCFERLLNILEMLLLTSLAASPAAGAAVAAGPPPPLPLPTAPLLPPPPPPPPGVPLPPPPCAAAGCASAAAAVAGAAAGDLGESEPMPLLLGGVPTIVPLLVRSEPLLLRTDPGAAPTYHEEKPLSGKINGTICTIACQTMTPRRHVQLCTDDLTLQ